MSDRPVKAMFNHIRSSEVPSIPKPPRLPSDEKLTAKPPGMRRDSYQALDAVDIQPKDRTQTYLLIQSMERNAPSAAMRLKREIALEILSSASLGDNPIYLTLSTAMDIVEGEFQRTIGKSLTANLNYAKERFREANKILHPVMSKGFRSGINED